MSHMLSKIQFTVLQLSGIIVLGLAFASTSAAQQQVSPHPPESTTLQQDDRKSNELAKPAKKEKPTVSAKRKEELLAFVQEHHSELAPLLDQLETSNALRYRQAIRGLNRTVSRLEAVKKRRPDRYPLALKHWILESRISVTAAKLSLNESDEVRAELESLVTELQSNTLIRLKKEQETLGQRQKKTQARIQEIESNGPKLIEQKIKQLTAKRSRSKKNDASQLKKDQQSE